MLDKFSYKILSSCVYSNWDEPAIDCEQIGKTYTNSQTGFRAKVFRHKDGEIVIAFCGTEIKFPYMESSKDVANDLNMAIGNLPPQAENAMALYNEIKNKYPNAKISLTGHSLGGSLAQIVAKETGTSAMVFNPFSTGDDAKDYPNIINIIHSEDFIAMSDLNTHPGKVYLIPNESGNILMPRLLSSLDNHKLENMDLLDLKSYEKGSIKSFMDKMKSGEAHQGLNTTRDVLSNVYDSWDNSRAKEFSYNVLAVKDKVKMFVNDTKSTISTYADKVQSKVTGYVNNSQNGRWVTIDGNHVFIEN